MDTAARHVRCAGSLSRPTTVPAEPAEHRGVQSLAPLSSHRFRDVIGHFASGVSVITACANEQPVGTTASALCSLSLEPPMVVVCMNKTSQTRAVIDAAGQFAVNILSETQGALAQHFATKHPNKFADVSFQVGPFGQPLLEDALAHLECRVTERLTGGTHTVFLAEVHSATAWSRNPLAYFRGRYGRVNLDEAADAQTRS
ncbi:MAG: flavin reductase domain protein FMN-binding protein [Solirubrobacterales bacterium]|nr:flavin reductase domain protein FMN-binding protein [Solirubrobacterales bacterium]